ncbi:MAG: hypothetical protein ING59_01885 [Burkholderiales bacterium]|nr:hypothetical protein [Burkholderiales bacterium]
MLDLHASSAKHEQVSLPRRLVRRQPRIRLGHQTRRVLRSLLLALLAGLLVRHGDPEPRRHPGPVGKTALPLVNLPLGAP